MNIGLCVFPRFTDTHLGERTPYAQRLEPSVLYLAPESAGVRSVFIDDNRPRADVDLYLCSVYTRGWREFREFSRQVGRDRVVAGGYHPTAMPEACRPYAAKVVTGLCGDIEEILADPRQGVFAGKFSARRMRRDLVDMRRMCQVFPDVMPGMMTGSSNTSVGCPYDCDFCSTPTLSGRRMFAHPLEAVEADIADLKSYGTEVVFIRDESFATHPMFDEVVRMFGRADFKIPYSFGTGSAMTEAKIRLLAENGWHSLCFGLEDIGVSYRKNFKLAEACRLCHAYGIRVTLSFIVNDDGKSREEAEVRYRALYDAFQDLMPAQVCSNFLMPFPGTGIWDRYRGRIGEDDWVKYDSKTPILSPPELREWHRQTALAVQLAHYHSSKYAQLRNFRCGDTQDLRFRDLERQFGMEDGRWSKWFEPGSSASVPVAYRPTSRRLQLTVVSG